MNDPIPTIRLRNAWRGSHPWIFQKLVDKPAQRPKPGSVVDVVGVDGPWIGRGFYNGHSRIALRLLEADTDVAVHAAWVSHSVVEPRRLRPAVLDLTALSAARLSVTTTGHSLAAPEGPRSD